VRYGSRGFVVLAFPCNQFGGQEPGSHAEIKQFAKAQCAEIFPLFAKIDVNGSDEDPLFTFLKDEQGGFMGRNIMWNFTKFLVDRHGRPTVRFGPQTPPLSFEQQIVELLEAPVP